jgi:hypothetical protein
MRDCRRDAAAWRHGHVVVHENFQKFGPCETDTDWRHPARLIECHTSQISRALLYHMHHIILHGTFVHLLHACSTQTMRTCHKYVCVLLVCLC